MRREKTNIPTIHSAQICSNANCYIIQHRNFARPTCRINKKITLLALELRRSLTVGAAMFHRCVCNL